MQRSDALKIMVFATILVCLASPALVLGIQGRAQTCQELISLLRKNIASVCPSNPLYCCWAQHGCNSPLCAGDGGSSGDGWNTQPPEPPGMTNDEVMGMLNGEVADAYGTNDASEFDFDSLSDIQKANVEGAMDEIDEYRGLAEDRDNTELVNRIDALEQIIIDSGEEPPISRAERLSMPFVGGRGSYGWEISTYGYPNLDWLAQTPEFPKLTLWHDEDGTVHYYYEDETESVYSGTKKPIPFEGFGVRQGQEIAMPKMASYLKRSSGIAASAEGVNWGHISFVTGTDPATELQVIRPTVKVDEDAAIGRSRFSINIKDENGTIIDTIYLAADIQPKSGGGLVVYAEKIWNDIVNVLFSIIAVLVFLGVIYSIVKERIKIWRTKNPAEKAGKAKGFGKRSIYKILFGVGLLMVMLGFIFILEGLGSDFTTSSIYQLVVLVLGMVIIFFSGNRAWKSG